MTAPPMNFSSTPPYCSIHSFASRWYSWRTSRTSSGSALSARAVDPTRSMKRTETSFRSSWAGAASPRGAPQLLQKRAAGGFPAPQLAHWTSTAVMPLSVALDEAAFKEDREPRQREREAEERHHHRGIDLEIMRLGS